EVMQDTCLCALGTSAPNPVLSTITYFRNEYLSHIKEHKCPGKVCKPLINFYIDKNKCNGCHACVKVCSTQAIYGDVKKVHSIDLNKCVKCGACIEVCTKDAIFKA
ncbi:MAG: 4Fe-4S binding protein, partial [Thermoanaerobaculaceae bacterium]|nr:4Fe-4S binding protein [Thermoanaerobaculaceae bacterium]